MKINIHLLEALWVSMNLLGMNVNLVYCKMQFPGWEKLVNAWSLWYFY